MRPGNSVRVMDMRDRVQKRCLVEVWMGKQIDEDMEKCAKNRPRKSPQYCPGQNQYNRPNDKAVSVIVRICRVVEDCTCLIRRPSPEIAFAKNLIKEKYQEYRRKRNQVRQYAKQNPPPDGLATRSGLGDSSIENVGPQSVGKNIHYFFGSGVAGGFSRVFMRVSKSTFGPVISRTCL